MQKILGESKEPSSSLTFQSFKRGCVKANAHDGNHASLVPEMGNGNNTCQPKLITKTNKWLAHASGSRAFVPLDNLCEEFVCEEFVCEDRTRVLVPVELCGSTADFIDDGLPSVSTAVEQSEV